MNKKEKWLRSPWTFMAAVLVAGPFALPLLWRNPRYPLSTKILWSLLVVALTAALLWGSARLNQILLDLTQP